MIIKKLNDASYEKLDRLRRLYPGLEEQLLRGLDPVDCLELQIKDTEHWKELATQLATHALVGLSGVVCTPAEGYLAAPQCLKRDIAELRRLATEGRHDDQ